MVDVQKRSLAIDDLRARRDEILALAKEYGVSNVRVVGSVARGDATAESDVDFLMSIPPGRSVFDLVGLWLDMQELLGCPVSIIPDSVSDEAFKQSVVEDAVSL